MERVTEQEQNVDVFEDDISMYLTLYCDQEGIEDMRKAPQNVWTSALRYIHKHTFADGRLKRRKLVASTSATSVTNHNAYDYDLVLDVLDIYIFDLCMRYDKIVTVDDFSVFTGISRQQIYNWGDGKVKLSNATVDVRKKLNYYNEISLANRLSDGKGNPIGTIARLRRWHSGWDGDANNNAGDQKRVSADTELRRLSVSGTQIEDKKQDIVAECEVTQDIVV